MSSLTLASAEQDKCHPTRRQAVKVNVAHPEDVEATPLPSTSVRPSDIVKIFLGDEEIAEVTAEQVQRVKMSK